MNRYSLLFCLSTYLLAGTEAALEAEGIVGGDEAFPDELSYQVALVPGWKGAEVTCGGAIIGDRHVLTAAHCVTVDNATFTTYPMTVVAGASDLDHKDSKTVIAGVKKVYIPSEYRGFGQVGDIAVLKLKRSLRLNSNIHLSKVGLPKANRSYAGVQATIAGYGWTWAKIDVQFDPLNVTETGGNDMFKKKSAIADVLSNSQCQYENPLQVIFDKQICAKMQQRYRNGKTEGVCTGDSGGPLVYNDSIVIGVLSSSRIGCDESKAPAIYTRVSSYLDFIRNAMANRVTSSMRVYVHPKFVYNSTLSN